MRGTAHHIDRRVIFGLIFVVVIGLIIAATVAQYRGAFKDTVGLTVESDRAGLTLADGAPIKLRGVEIGTVGHVTTSGGRVRIELELEADRLKDVPADVTAQIVPPTAFGAKYVQLTAPDGGTTAPIRAGSVIPATRVTVEIDEAFQNLTHVLDVARPASVNAAVTALAGAVDQRGKLIGRFITLTETYLAGLNPSLPRLSADLRLIDDVVGIYDKALPDLMRTLRGSATISDTLVRQQASLRAYSLSLSTFSDEAGTLLRSARPGLISTLTQLEPVTGTVARYSPELPCLVLGLASANKLAEAAVGGTQPGIATYTRVVPERVPYAYPENLPVMGDDRGPRCYGLPSVSPQEARHAPPAFETGANPYAQSDASRADSGKGSIDALLGELARGATQP